MNKSMLMGVALGALGVAATTAIGSYVITRAPEAPVAAEVSAPEPAPKPAFAEVLAVEPVKETSKTPRQVCENVVVTRQAPVKDEHKIAGTAVGAVVGGLLGNQVGGGSGKKIATVAGAVAGGYAGNKVQGNMQQNDTQTTTEQRCHSVTDTSEKVVGYNVKYRYDGEEKTTYMSQRPSSDKLPVVDGKVVPQS
ncbi:glycine zipper 2TM domain-containing protein [Atopomonas sediminilitoris]|uniref:glycine zipper 2TM domain-containing protein n=1 Tax=Atopomonas sediminilitoris TaxID=2919919 RepID=UPI001F4E5226|nr:glycine zipper 2TM domain-containing protein [Atopomonas sediminilitoris]MCJ8169018.1 glycine zipper 2TM domain-containing protein [Atopomonas sediminilitoris]